MRHLYVIAYDVVDDRRRAKVHRVLSGFGTALQYSVFRCALTPLELTDLRAKLWEIFNPAVDRILLADLGPEASRGAQALEIWGQELEQPLPSSEPLIF
jgi:CRISPR-associated protein Cas2